MFLILIFLIFDLVKLNIGLLVVIMFVFLFDLLFIKFLFIIKLMYDVKNLGVISIGESVSILFYFFDIVYFLVIFIFLVIKFYFLFLFIILEV